MIGQTLRGAKANYNKKNLVIYLLKIFFFSIQWLPSRPNNIEIDAS